MMRKSGLLLTLILFAASCASAVRVGLPLQIAEAPESLVREKLSVAVVGDPALVKTDSIGDPELARKTGAVLAEGLAEATRVLCEKATVVSTAPDSGYDLVVTPANFYMDRAGSASVDISLDIKILRVKDRKEFGMLIKGSGAPGPRPLASIQVNSQALHLAGAHLPNGPFGQALNNALFDITVDYMKNMGRRLETLRDPSR